MEINYGSFKTFKPFNRYTRSNLHLKSSPATRWRMKERGLNDLNFLNGLNE